MGTQEWLKCRLLFGLSDTEQEEQMLHLAEVPDAKIIRGDPNAKITFLRHFDSAFPSSNSGTFIAVHKIFYTSTSGFCIMAIHISKQYF